MIRASGDLEALRSALRAAIHEMDKSVPLYEVSPLDEYLSRSAAQPRFQTILLSGFAGVSLLLAAIGLYGLLSYSVVQRTHQNSGYACRRWARNARKYCA